MLTSLVLSTTYKCPIQCRYCGAECSPKNKERLSRQERLTFIDKVHSFGKLRLVVFTGGEPFLLGKDLLYCVNNCHGLGLSTRIVTNAYWAKSPELADKMIKKYKEAGLSEINLSCDDYHQEFIPLERIKYANDACIKNDMPCLIGHKVMKECTITLEYLEEYFGRPLTRYDKNKTNPPNNLISSGYTVPVADDMHLIEDEAILYPENDQQWKEPCSSILQRVIITPKKELSICCGMVPRKVQEVFFGPLDSVSLEEAIVEAHQDLIVNWLALEGPYGLMKFILKKDPSIPFRKQYVNICHLCSEIFTRNDCRSILNKYGQEKTFEVSLERTLYDIVRTSPRIIDNHLLPS